MAVCKAAALVCMLWTASVPLLPAFLIGVKVLVLCWDWQECVTSETRRGHVHGAKTSSQSKSSTQALTTGMLLCQGQHQAHHPGAERAVVKVPPGSMEFFNAVRELLRSGLTLVVSAVMLASRTVGVGALSRKEPMVCTYHTW